MIASSSNANTSYDLHSIYFLSNAGIVIVFSYLVLLLNEKGISEKEIAYLAIPFSIALMISNFLSGRLSDERGRRPFLLVGLFLSSFSTILYILPNTFWNFTLARILNGITLGIFPSSIIGAASDRHIKIGKISSFGSIGWAAGAMIGGIIAQYSSLEFAFIIGGMLYFSAFLITYLFHTGKKVEQNEMNSLDEQEKSLNNGFSLQYATVIKKNWLVYLVLILRHGTANSIWLFWALFLTKDLNLSTSQIGIVQATNMLTQFVFMQAVSDKYTPEKLFIVGGIFSSIAFFSFTLSSTFIEIVLTQIILGMSWAFFYVGGLRSVEIKCRDDNLVATGTGLFNSSISIAQIVGPFIALYLYSISQAYILSMQVAAVITLSSIMLYIPLYLRS